MPDMPASMADSPFRAMMFHAVGLKAMASKEIVNEVFEMSTNEWKSNEKTGILENQPRVTVQSERNVDVNFGSSDADKLHELRKLMRAFNPSDKSVEPQSKPDLTKSR
jgi:hypothetical protein